MVLVKCKKCQKVRNYTGTITDKAKIQCKHSHTPSTKECSWVDENGVTIECPFLKQGEKYRCGYRGVDIIDPQQ